MGILAHLAVSVPGSTIVDEGADGKGFLQRIAIFQCADHGLLAPEAILFISSYGVRATGKELLEEGYLAGDDAVSDAESKDSAGSVELIAATWLLIAEIGAVLSGGL